LSVYVRTSGNIQEQVTFQLQADAVLVQAAPVQNTWYTVLNTQNARVLGIAYEVAATGETLEVRMTIDGRVFTPSQAAVAGTDYYIKKDHTADWGFALPPDVTQYINQLSFLFDCRSLKVEMRKTTANGVGALTCRVAYQKR